MQSKSTPHLIFEGCHIEFRVASAEVAGEIESIGHVGGRVHHCNTGKHTDGDHDVSGLGGVGEWVSEGGQAGPARVTVSETYQAGGEGTAHRHHQAATGQVQYSSRPSGDAQTHLRKGECD
ncbi:hypothetical protein E2C01_018107 [Portunus trituberculatus]|uniref:Uncharacterized protein n=1 Tax=Portunus trituberculatus TaxID=210409 RepID=A0A5B7DTN6_PORTR|nr:hypothetical protein [Portunus trituberculatus]